MTIFRHALAGLRGQVIAYGLGLAAWGVLEAALFQTVRDTLGGVEYPEELLEAFGATSSNLSNPRTFMDVEFFSLGPIIAATFALFAGTGALAGEEGGGTMELLASLPVSRTRMFAEKLLAAGVALIGVCVVISLGWFLVVPFSGFGRELSVWRLVGATFVQLSFAGFMVVTGLLLGAIAPSRSAAGAWSAVLLVASYLLVVISSIATSVEDLRYFSPYYYSDLTGVLSEGVEASHQFALWSASAAVGWLGLRAFNGRELGAERWQFDAVLRGGPRIAAYAAGPQRLVDRARRWTRGRSSLWWAGATAVLVLASGGTGALGGQVLAGARGADTVQLDGRIDAAHSRVLAPATGTIRTLLVASGDAVVAGQDLGWMQNVLDGAVTPLRAPLTGRITELSVRSGEFALAGSPVAVVYDLDSPYAVFEVDESDVDQITTGQRIEVTITVQGTTFSSRVASVTAVPLSGDGVRSRDDPQYEVKTERLALDGRLAVGMLADAQVHVPPQ